MSEADNDKRRTVCCDYEGEPVIFWNPFNKVTQCHNCGQVYEIPAPKESVKAIMEIKE